MGSQGKELLLSFYAAGPDRTGKQDFFTPVLIVMLLLAGGTGWYLKIHNPPPVSIEERISQIQTEFIIEEKPVVKEVVKPKPLPLEKKVEVEKPKEPIDLTEKPVLNQKLDDIVKPQTDEQPKPVRRVYGLKKVYSTGFGASGNAADAVIGKLGNTLNTEIDTFTATTEELKGQLVSITRVTKQPELKVRAIPEYSKEMLENKVEGIIKAKLLIDIDGKVKKIIVLNDLGFGSKEKVYENSQKLVFVPAMIGEDAVASWVVFTFTFKII
ncbi:MAG TPA: energy transducer TonB [Chitinispirillaceae bacterium]|nr:energy transducer TonB [Chitinispirillaceae bacterium]